MATKKRKRKSGLRGTPAEHLTQAAELKKITAANLRANNTCAGALMNVGDAAVMREHALEAGVAGRKLRKAAIRTMNSAVANAKKLCGCGR